MLVPRQMLLVFCEPALKWKKGGVSLGVSGRAVSALSIVSSLMRNLSSYEASSREQTSNQRQQSRVSGNRRLSFVNTANRKVVGSNLNKRTSTNIPTKAGPEITLLIVSHSQLEVAGSLGDPAGFFSSIRATYAETCYINACF